MHMILQECSLQYAIDLWRIYYLFVQPCVGFVVLSNVMCKVPAIDEIH